MYESFYGFREKPFSLLPDPSFLYLSDKHRMALTLLEYGLMNQAGFTVISGDIGTGKTTLIRRLLEQISPDIKVGLITNTHQSFGDLMQWIALAFDLPHDGKSKVELYRDFMDFIIQEYAEGRRTVLIVDEAQNMSAETLEELRMLSNVNADKDQVLQIILIGQRELRETLRRPDLIQFAQRIGVDYHLEPLTEDETRLYISHRCATAGGKESLFTDTACQLIHEVSKGVPRLINLICDTALVYGYAGQKEQLNPDIISEVIKDKQKGGLLSLRTHPTNAAGKTTPRENAAVPRSRAAIHRYSATQQPAKRVARKEGPLRVAIVAESELLRIYLSRLLSTYNIEVVATLPLTYDELSTFDIQDVDVLHVELDNRLENLDDKLYELFESWQRPVLFNDSLATEASLSQLNRREYGEKLSQKLFSMGPDVPQSVA